MSELLPCPFCGGEPDEYEGEYGNGIYCMECGAMVGEPIHLGFNIAERVSYEQAVEAWNTRHVETCRMIVPVVRCRDCKHYREHEWFGIKGTPLGTDVEHACMFFSDGVKVEPDGFCAWGEEKEDGNDTD